MSLSRALAGNNTTARIRQSRAGTRAEPRGRKAVHDSRFRDIEVRAAGALIARLAL
jgi:hypothetical protein